MSHQVADIPWRREDGVATVIFPMVLWFGCLVAIVIIDIGAYLVAAARAQAAADAAALAAVSSTASESYGVPRTAARRAAVAVGGALDACDCGRGQDYAEVTVSVPVPGLVVPRFGAGRVAADASAVLVDNNELPPSTSPPWVTWPPGS